MLAPRTQHRTKARGAATHSERSEVSRTAHDVLRPSEQALGQAARGSTQPGFGYDFSRIPVHPVDKPAEPSVKPGAGHESTEAVCPHKGPDTQPGILQPKLAIGQVNDPLEHEAEHVAEQVIRIPDPGGKEGAAPLSAEQTRPAQAGGDEVPGLVYEVLRSPGQPLDPGTRAFFEPRLGHDFSSVRVHADAAAAASARAVRAQAYTVGPDLVFAEGQYAPHGGAGRRLLAHELTHTVQQGSIADLGPTAKRANGSASNGILVQRQPSESAPSQAAVKGVQNLTANEIAQQWDQNKSVFIAAASAQDNTLGGHQLFQIWLRYWTDLHNAAVDREKQVRTALWKADKVSYANNIDLFQNGKRDALGPEYQDAADRLDSYNYMLSGEERLLNWLEDWVDTAHHHLTFKQVNEKALEIAKAQAMFETWFAPIIFGILGGVLAQPARGPGPEPVPQARQLPPGPEPVPPARQLPPGPEPVPPARQLPPGPQPVPQARQLPPGPQPVPPARQLPPGPQPVPQARQLPPGPQPVPPARQLPPGPQPVPQARQLPPPAPQPVPPGPPAPPPRPAAGPAGPPAPSRPAAGPAGPPAPFPARSRSRQARQLPPGPQPVPQARQLPPGPQPVPPARQLPPGPQPVPPARQLPPGPQPVPPARQLPPGPSGPTPATSGVVQQNIRNPTVRVGSGSPWTGKGPPPQWSNPKSVKAYDHIESTHGPNLKPANFQGRSASGAPQQGQWYNDDWVAAEQMAPQYPGDYIVEFGRPVGRVYNDDGTVTENVTRAFVQRRPDGTLNSAYPVDANFTLR